MLAQSGPVREVYCDKRMRASPSSPAPKDLRSSRLVLASFAAPCSMRRQALIPSLSRVCPDAGAQGACCIRLASKVLPTRTEVHSFSHGRIGVRREKLSERDLRCSFPGEHGVGARTHSAWPTWRAICSELKVHYRRIGVKGTSH